MDSRDIWTLATENLPEEIVANTNLASSSGVWFRRLAESIQVISAERDEAREVAQRLLELGSWNRVQQLYASRHPWLKVSSK